MILKPLKTVLPLLAGGMTALQLSAAPTPDRPLRVLYLGAGDSGASPRGPGGRTNYVYLPGQTLAPEAIYFDHRADVTQATEASLKHFDAVVQVSAEGGAGAATQKLEETFKSRGGGWIKYTNGQRPTDAVLREAVLGGVSPQARSAWEASLKARPTRAIVRRGAQL